MIILARSFLSLRSMNCGIYISWIALCSSYFNFRFTFFSLNGPYYFLTSLLTCKSHFCMILLIYRFFPVFSSTSNQTFVDSSLINRALNGPYCSPLIIICEFIFYIFLSVTLPCNFTSYLLGKSLLGFSRSSFINESFVTKSSPSEL